MPALKFRSDCDTYICKHRWCRIGSCHSMINWSCIWSESCESWSIWSWLTMWSFIRCLHASNSIIIISCHWVWRWMSIPLSAVDIYIQSNAMPSVSIANRQLRLQCWSTSTVRLQSKGHMTVSVFAQSCSCAVIMMQFFLNLQLRSDNAAWIVN